MYVLDTYIYIYTHGHPLPKTHASGLAAVLGRHIPQRAAITVVFAFLHLLVDLPQLQKSLKFETNSLPT